MKSRGGEHCEGCRGDGGPHAAGGGGGHREGGSKSGSEKIQILREDRQEKQVGY